MSKSPLNILRHLCSRSQRFAVAGCCLMLLALGSSCSGGSNKDSYYNEQDAAATDANVEAAKRAAEADAGKGVGPVKSVELAGLDATLAEKGHQLFESKCTACHQLSDQKVVGPGLKGVTQRRKPEWIMNMIVNPEEMTKKDPVAQELLAEHLTQMTNQNVTETDARAILEYLRQNDEAK